MCLCHVCIVSNLPISSCMCLSTASMPMLGGCLQIMQGLRDLSSADSCFQNGLFQSLILCCLSRLDNQMAGFCELVSALDICQVLLTDHSLTLLSTLLFCIHAGVCVVGVSGSYIYCEVRACACFCGAHYLPCHFCSSGLQRCRPYFRADHLASFDTWNVAAHSARPHRVPNIIAEVSR